ncbi:GNAT family N-acetyltransferase [Fictibacillus sp. KIGAM418]|uniref:GNAT family N-acetyltransferase n=1 Tax=Fictibacillus marinisediminis TaxID=2878389 RepID=A0A9X1X982_9BACL|nr:GNAT family N-acetyltransferase [Fictibacillus marinisediminis]MCK6256233.1 GNAT family N-acetyltransferase [Fictibacillus marinisediminis]
MSVRSVFMNEEHLDACIELYQNVFNSSPWNESWTVETAKERLSDLVNTPKFLGFVFYESGQFIGFIAGNSKRTYNGVTFYIAELCVNNKIQGKGYGTKMLNWFEEELKRREIQSLYLLTSKEGLAEAFYLKNGYNVNNNRIVMRKEL